jgi:hypothetical protein
LREQEGRERKEEKCIRYRTEFHGAYRYCRSKLSGIDYEDKTKSINHVVLGEGGDALESAGFAAGLELSLSFLAADW